MKNRSEKLSPKMERSSYLKQNLIVIKYTGKIILFALKMYDLHKEISILRGI